jgi:glycosyltransferase involved in cell wall biosynthesis
VVNQVIPLVLNFGMGVWSGWGVVGMNLLGQLALDKDLMVLASLPLGSSQFTGLDPYHYKLIEQVTARKWEYNDECIWMDCIGNDLRGSDITARVKVARAILEKPDVQAADGLSSYSALLTGSRWCADLIENISGRPARVIHEGIDPSLFYPAERSGWFTDGRRTFNIYSCGKVEYRKGQDLILRAFRIFSARRNDARLITIWNSPFSDLGNGYKGTLEHPIWMKENGFLDVQGWAVANGIDGSKVMELGCVPNWMLPQVLKEMDVFITASRIESCTSMPLMEALACGVPVIAPDHSGLADIVDHHLCKVLSGYKPISASSEYFFPRTDIDWYECDVDEMVESLEWVYQHREEARRKACLASAWIREHRNWRIHAEELKAWLLELYETQSNAQSRPSGLSRLRPEGVA